MASTLDTTDEQTPALGATTRDAEVPLTLTAIRTLIEEEEREAGEVIYLTANETALSPFAQGVLSSDLGNRYLVEHLEMRKDSPARLGNFLCRGLDHINRIERSAAEVCRQMFGARYAEFRCLSGLHAMQTTIAALSEPGDMIMRVATKDGGHFLTEMICTRFGRRTCTCTFARIGEIDLDRTAQTIRRERPALLYVDAMNHLFPLPLAELKEIAGGVPLVYDASHTLGLIAGGRFQRPLAEGADVLQANTHKTFFGPQKGIILGNDTGLMERIGYALSNGMVSSQHTAPTLALFIALHEMHLHGREFAPLVLENARHLAQRLHDRGLTLVASERGFTRNHMLLIDTRALQSSLVLLTRLLAANLAVNRIIAFENVDGLRLGVQEITRRGYTDDEVDQVADWIAAIVLGQIEPESVRDEAAALAHAHRRLHFCDEPALPALCAPKPRPLALASSVRPSKPRWINTRLVGASMGNHDEDAFEAARRLGALAGTYEHQTDAAGNVSFHMGGRTYVSATGAYIKALAAADFVELLDCDDWTLTCRGCGQPSSESYLHYLTRKVVPATFIVHNHYIPLVELKGLDVVVIPPQEYGSVELAEAVADAARAARLIYVRRHGLVFWGESFEECRSALRAFAAIDPGSRAARASRVTGASASGDAPNTTTRERSAP